jgi:O-antigen/teichoic acid export membrane protein
MKKLIKHMSIYGLGGILTKSINFLLLPLYTRVLAPADYGALELVYMVGYIIAILYGLMIGSGYIRFYFDGQDEKKRQIYFGSSFWFTFVNSIIFALLSFVFAEDIARFIFKFDNGSLFIKLISVATAINAHKQILYNHLQVKERSSLYISINVISVVLTLALTIFFVAYLKWGVEGVLYAQVYGFSAELVILLAILFRRSIFLFSLSAIKEMLLYSIPLIPIQIAVFFINLSDRFFLQSYRSLDEVGLYALGYKFASILPLFAIQPLRAFTPYIFSLIHTPDVCKKTLADFTRYYLAGLLFLVLAISLYSREVIVIMSVKSFYTSWTVVFMLCISFVFYGVLNISSYAIEIVKKNWISGFFWVLAAIISVSLNFFLVPLLGMYGSALSSMISYLTILACYFIAVSIVYPVPFDYKKMIFITLLASCIYALSLFIPNNILLSLIVKSTLLLLYIVILLLSSYFSTSEKAMIKDLCSSFLVRTRKSCTVI